MAYPYTADDIRHKLHALQQAQGWAKTAAQLGISIRYLRDIVRGDREPTTAAVQSLCLERIVTYRKAS